MRRSNLFGGFLVSAALMLLPTLSHAKDYCLTFPDAPAFVLVGQGFVEPAKGKCKPWNGFTPQTGKNSPSAGVGCASSDGSHLNLTITTSGPEIGAIVLFDSITLTLPSRAGTDNETAISNGSSSANSGNVNGGACPSKIAIPAVQTGGSSSRIGLIQ